MTRADVVAAARSLLGVPYHPHGRSRVGIDCAGLPIVVARMCGLMPESFDINGYSLHPDGTLIERCREHLDQVDRADMKPGHVLVVSWGHGQAQHFGIVGDHPKYKDRLSMIHAEAFKHKRVIETRLVFTSHMRYVATFAFRGID